MRDSQLRDWLPLPVSPNALAMTTSNLESELELFTDVACTLCGCVCDDLRIGVQQGEVKLLENACALAAPWFRNQSLRTSCDCTIEGEQVPFDDAIRKAASLLRSAKNPLVSGFSASSTSGQRAACELADWVGANIDPNLTGAKSPAILAVQRIGQSTASLGEIRNRSDLVIYWGSNPVKSQPRHHERFTGGSIRGESRSGTESESRRRFLVVVDIERTETAEVADMFLQVEPGRDFEVLWGLRALVQGVPLDSLQIGGVDVEELKEFAMRMKNCQYGAVFFGAGITQGTVPHLTVEALFSLVTDLQKQTRFVVRGMQAFGTAAGADQVLTWQTGYPCSVNLNRGYPRYQPGEFSATELIQNQETDLVILVGTGGLTKLSIEALAELGQIPTIVLTHEESELPFLPTVTIPVATYGVHLSGTVYRTDETPIPLRPFLKTRLPSDEVVLQQIIELVRVPVRG